MINSNIRTLLVFQKCYILILTKNISSGASKFHINGSGLCALYRTRSLSLKSSFITHLMQTWFNFEQNVINQWAHVYLKSCICAGIGPLCENMMSLTKPKAQVYNVLQCYQRRTKPQPQTTCKKSGLRLAVCL